MSSNKLFKSVIDDNVDDDGDDDDDDDDDDEISRNLNQTKKLIIHKR